LTHTAAPDLHTLSLHDALPILIGLAGTGDLVATALAPQSRNRRAGELLAQGIPAAQIPERIGQAIESLESVPLLAHALGQAGIEDRKSTRLNSSHDQISYAVFC